MRICHKNHVLRGNLLTVPLFCHKKRSQRGRNRLPPAFCHKFALFRGKLPHFSSFCRKKGTLRGNSLFRLCRRQGCVRDSRFRRAASVLDVPFAAELAILAATHPKSLTQSSQFASRTGASASAGYFALLKVSSVRILSALVSPGFWFCGLRLLFCEIVTLSQKDLFSFVHKNV